MNKEIIQTAIRNGTLRKYDLTQAQAGDKVLGWEPGEVLAVYGKNVVIGWDLRDGKVVCVYPASSDNEIYLAPLCWVEDKPVYKGDVLYRTSLLDTCSVVAKELSEDGRFIRFEGNYDSALDGSRSKLSWSDPTILFEVEGKPVRKGDVLYGTWMGSKPIGYEITGKNDMGWPTWHGGVLTDKPEKLTWTKTKPKAAQLNINGHLVPAPEREPLPYGTTYYTPLLLDGKAATCAWYDDQTDHHRLNSGLIHLTKEAALKHAQALISISKS